MSDGHPPAHAVGGGGDSPCGKTMDRCVHPDVHNDPSSSAIPRELDNSKKRGAVFSRPAWRESVGVLAVPVLRVTATPTPGVVRWNSTARRREPRMSTWLITGCSTGLGRALARAALDRGDNAVVT